MTYRERFLDLTRGLAQTPPVFIPLIGGLLTKFSGRSAQETFTDVTTLSNSLRDAQRLLRADVNLVLIDSAVFAEGVGADVRWNSESPEIVDAPWQSQISGLPDVRSGWLGLFLDALRRLKRTQADVGTGVILPGPAKLGGALQGSEFVSLLLNDDPYAEDVFDASGRYIAEMVKASSESESDLIVILDDTLPQLNTADKDLAEIGWGAVANLAKFYEKPLILTIDRTDVPSEGLKSLRTWGITARNWRSISGLKHTMVGVGITKEDLNSRASKMELPTAARSTFISTTSPSDSSTDLSQLRLLRDVLDEWPGGG